MESSDQELSNWPNLNFAGQLVEKLHFEEYGLLY